MAQAQEPQKSPNARGPKAEGHWVTSFWEVKTDFGGPIVTCQVKGTKGAHSTEKRKNYMHMS